ncbi:MAG: response regulator, partial [Immundisolibacteraceae bacterium]|nr:response regulator [Immundisolibacteraceae bacterium]
MTAKRVLICDDSALIRQLLSEILSADPELEVVGVASDASIAREMIKTHNPDVMTLDVEMPGMDGITFLRNIMRLRPMPVVMVSTLTERGAEISLDALSIGAVDCVAKPKTDVTNSLHHYASEICEIVRIAADAKVSAKSTVTAAKAAGHITEFHAASGAV